jgi:hypothetical protein
MNFRWYILTLGLLLLARPAPAETPGSIVWKLTLAPAIDEPGVDDDACPANPYALYRRGCPDELNIGLERSDTRRLNTLDRLLLLADRYKALNLDTDIGPRTRLKFNFGLVNLYQQEVQARIAVRIQF